MFVNWSKSLDNSDQAKWPQLGSHCISANLLFITCWLPIAFLATAVPNVSAALKSLIPVLLPGLLAAHNLTSYWENWNHPNLSLPSCLCFNSKNLCISPSLLLHYLEEIISFARKQHHAVVECVVLESDKVKYSLLTCCDPDKFSSFTASMSWSPKWMYNFLPHRVIKGD